MFCHAKDNCQFCMVIKKFPGSVCEDIWHSSIIEWMLLVYNYVIIIRHYFEFLQSVFNSQSEWLFFSYVWARTPNQEGLWILWSNFDYSTFNSRERQRYCVILSIYLSYKVINSTNKCFFNSRRRVLSAHNYQAYLSSSSSRLRLIEAPELFSGPPYPQQWWVF